MHSTNNKVAQGAVSAAKVSIHKIYTNENPEPQSQKNKSEDIFLKTLHTSLISKSIQCSPKPKLVHSLRDDILLDIFGSASGSSMEIDGLSSEFQNLSSQ